MGKKGFIVYNKNTGEILAQSNNYRGALNELKIFNYNGIKNLDIKFII